MDTEADSLEANQMYLAGIKLAKLQAERDTAMRKSEVALGAADSRPNRARREMYFAAQREYNRTSAVLWAHVAYMGWHRACEAFRVEGSEENNEAMGEAWLTLREAQKLAGAV